MDNSIKVKLHKLCHESVSQRLNTIRKAIAAAREAANNETKSTAGDKYETERAMMQFEQEKLGRQLKETEALLEQLKRVDPLSVHKVAATGSLIKTSQGNFYLTVGAGRLELEGEEYMAVSPLSPIGKLFTGKKTGQEIELNGRKYTITEVL